MSRGEKRAHATRPSSGLPFILIVTTHLLLVSFSSPYTNSNGSLIETTTCRGKWCTTGAIINFRLSTAPKTASDHRSPSSCCTSSSSVTNCDFGYSHDSRHDATCSSVTTPTLALSHVSTRPLHAGVPPAMDPAPASSRSPFATVPRCYLIEDAEKVRSSLFGGVAVPLRLN